MYCGEERESAAAAAGATQVRLFPRTIVRVLALRVGLRRRCNEPALGSEFLAVAPEPDNKSGVIEFFGGRSN